MLLEVVDVDGSDCEPADEEDGCDVYDDAV